MSAADMAGFMSRADVQQLKDYVRGPSGQESGRADSTVLLQVTHSNLQARFMEIRFDRHMTVMRLKEKLKAHCGTSVPAMQLHLKDERGNPLAVMTDESKKLGFYSPQDGYILHIKDTDPMSASANGWLEDVSKVQKYEISDDDYNLRENSYRKFKEGKLKEDPNWCLKKEMALKRGETWKDPEVDPDAQASEAEGIEVGQRCEVAPGAKRGEIMFVGGS